MLDSPLKTIVFSGLIFLSLLSVGCFSDEAEEEAIEPLVVNEVASGITVGMMPPDRPMEFRGEFGCIAYCTPDVDEFAVLYSDAGTYSIIVRYNVKNIGGTYEYKDKDEKKITDLTTTVAYEDTVTVSTSRVITVTQGSYYAYADYDYAIEIKKK